ncbi:hypothetical protein N0V93_004003 [Gnomoniopsis smithogilvyi]|uniref:Methyltransferase domain-containing protein n=1 Tax=Gnomoniopsis smithogilvyi TaxID=1191159 RepID=A0A9W9D0K0_9PEZI|nr:hypothetical protein N0V93_004003 [Gnomoniopsis smithogilvyi]
MSSTWRVDNRIPTQRLVIRFPQREQKDVAQDYKQCEVVDGDKITTVRFHDYALTYSIPDLYNQLFGGADSETQCISPQVMTELLREHVHLVLENGPSVSGKEHRSLRVLDFGAGNGMIGEEVRLLASAYNDGSLANSTSVVGFDILPEAKMAAERDRPGVYDAYIVADITEYVKNVRAEPVTVCLAGFNVLVSVSALSFGDASAAALRAAVSLVQNGGLILFNLKAGLLESEGIYAGAGGTSDEGTEIGFSGLLQKAVAERRLKILAKKTYCHRFSATGKPLYYVAVVAIKHMPLD